MRRNKDWTLVGLRDEWDRNYEVLRILDQIVSGEAENSKRNNLIL